MKSLSLTASQIETLRELQVAYPDLSVVLIGASALSAHIPLGRSTGDIDLVVVAPIEPLATMLTAIGWQRDAKRFHRWRCVGNAIADILPATEQVLREAVIRFEDGSEMSAIGFDLVLRHAELVSVGERVTVAIASLPAIAILKMVAWLDRPYERLKDVEDLTRIFEYALDDDDERRWNPEHPVGASGLDHEAQSYFSVGVEMARIADSSHRAVVQQFLQALRGDDSLPVARMLRASRGPADDEGARRLRRLLDAFEAGFATAT